MLALTHPQNLIMKNRITRFCLAAMLSASSLLALTPANVFAQPLAERVPGDAMFYVGWRGVDDMGPGFDQSHFKAVLGASEVGKLMTEFVPDMMAAEARSKPEEAARLELLGLLLPTMYKRGGAVFIGPAFFGGDGEMTPRLGLVVDAGADAPVLEAKVNAVIEANKAKVGKQANKATVVRSGNFVTALFGYDEKEAAAVGAAKMPPLTTNAAFTAALKQVHEKPAVISYVSIEDLVRLVDKTITTRGGAGMSAQQWKAASEALGLANIKRVICTGAFEGKSWGDRAFIESPVPRVGLASMLDSGPVTDEFLGMIPASAEVLAAGRFDGSKLFSESRTAAAKIIASMAPPKPGAARPEDAQNQALATFDKAIVQIGTMTGVDLKAELFDALGDEWAVFSDHSIAGGGDLSRVVINKPKDAVKLDKALSTISQIVPGILAMQLPGGARNIQMRQLTVGKDVIHYVDAAPIAPAWAIKDGVLYMATYPQVIVDAMAVVAAKGPSVLTNKDFVAMRKQFPAEKATMIFYSDLPQTIERSYPLLVAGSRVLASEGSKRGVIAPPMVIPPLSKVRGAVTVAGGVSWADNTGWHMATISPFPGAMILSMQSAGLLGAMGQHGPNPQVPLQPPDPGEKWETSPAPAPAPAPPSKNR